MSIVFIFFFLIVDVLGSDFNISCYPMGDEDYYGTVREHEINCFTIPVHFQKINFTIKAPDDGTLTLSIKVCNSTETSSFKIEPNTTTPFTLGSNDLLKEECKDGNRIDEIEVRVTMFHSNSTNSSDSASLSFQIINNNKIGIFTGTFIFMTFVIGVIIYILIIIFIAVYVCPPMEEEERRQNETEMNNENEPDGISFLNLNRPDGIQMANLNRPDRIRIFNLHRPDGTKMDNLNRPDETEMVNLNRPDETEIDALNRPDETEMDNLNNTPNNN